jgi:hypothetical protein
MPTDLVQHHQECHMTTIAINPSNSNLQARQARAPRRAIVLAFGLAWYGALMAAAVLPAHANAAPAAGHDAQAGVKDTAPTQREKPTCFPYRCR